MTILSYGTHQVDVTKLPEASVMALLRRGLSHLLGNEAAAKVNKDATDEEKAAQKNEAQLKFLEALASGTIGQSHRGPKVDPIEAEIARIVKREIAQVLKSVNVKMPKGDDTVSFGDGESAVALTYDDLVERRMTKHGDRIRKEAEKAVKAAQREADKAKAHAAAVAAKGPVSIDDLDL